MGGYIGARAGSLSTTTVANVQDVTATDTTPEVTIINSTHEDTDGGREGKVIFKGQQSGGEESTLAEIQASHDGTADDEKGDLIFKTNDGSDGASPTERLRIDSSGFLGINESAPSGTLHVKGTSSSHGKIILEAGGSAGTANNRFVEFNLEDGTKIAEIQVPQTITNGGGDIIFKTKHTSGTPADRMRVLASGALTVGSGTENAGYSPLQIGSTSTSSTIMQLLSSTAGAGTIHFGDAASGTGRYVGYLTYDHSGNNMAFGTSGSERMRIKGDGTIQFKGDLETVNSTMVMRFRDESENFKAGLQAVNSAGQMVGNSAVGDFAIRSQSNILFSTDGNTERMRLDTSGNLHIGRTSTGATGNGHTIRGGDSAVFSRNASGETVQVCRRNDQGDLIQFRRNGSICGEIVNTGSSSVAYNTSSDYRLKENVTDVTDGITRVKQLAPKRFNFIADGTDTKVEGFLAHEAQTVVPEAVTGTKDQVHVWNEDDELPDGVSLGDNKLDDSGNTIPKYQGIDQAKLVPLLTAALQEAIAKIETLETKVTALEAK